MEFESGRLLGLDEVWRMGPSLWDWCSSKKEEEMPGSACICFSSLSLPPRHHPNTQRKGQVRTLQEDGPLQTRKCAHMRHQIYWCLDLGVPASRNVRNKFMFFNQLSIRFPLLSYVSCLRTQPVLPVSFVNCQRRFMNMQAWTCKNR